MLACAWSMSCSRRRHAACVAAGTRIGLPGAVIRALPSAWMAANVSGAILRIRAPSSPAILLAAARSPPRRALPTLPLLRH